MRHSMSEKMGLGVGEGDISSPVKLRNLRPKIKGGMLSHAITIRLQMLQLQVRLSKYFVSPSATVATKFFGWLQLILLLLRVYHSELIYFGLRSIKHLPLLRMQCVKWQVSHLVPVWLSAGGNRNSAQHHKAEKLSIS